MSTAFPRAERGLGLERSRAGAFRILVALGILGAWTVWFLAARITIYEVSSEARLESDRALHPLSAPVDGTVVTSELALDRPVRTGDVLVEIESRTQRLQLEEERVRQAGIVPQIESLREEIAAGEKALADARKEAESALAEARAQVEVARSAARFAAEQLRSLARLKAEGQVAEIDFLRGKSEAERTQAQAEAASLELERRTRDRSRQVNEREAGLDRLRGEQSRLAAQTSSSRATSARLEEDIEKRLIRAPADGRVVEMASLQAGTFLSAGDRIGAVLASGRLKVFAVFPADRALGRVRPGQRARLRLAGFPWMQYGTVPATVAGVASEVRDGGVRVEFEVHPSPQSSIPLQHGLPGTVEVEVERRTPAELALRALGRRLLPVSSELADSSPSR